MREFPAKFIATNTSLFSNYKYDRDICYLREAIYEHFLQEPSYEIPFDLERFNQSRAPVKFDTMIQAVCAELQKLGWKTTIGHHNSALWIYSTPPKSLPEW